LTNFPLGGLQEIHQALILNGATINALLWLEYIEQLVLHNLLNLLRCFDV
jgi:hypothetical protein